MNRNVTRAEARATYWQEDFVALWSTALWILAAVYLLATFNI